MKNYKITLSTMLHREKEIEAHSLEEAIAKSYFIPKEEFKIDCEDESLAEAFCVGKEHDDDKVKEIISKMEGEPFKRGLQFFVEEASKQ